MYHSPISTRARGAELLDGLGELADPERRAEAVASLARALGGERLLLFAADPELGVPLPAPGLPQVLRGALEWRAFVEACVRQGECAGRVPDADPVPALGCALPDGTAAVLTHPAPGAALASLRPLLPLLGSLFRAERRHAADAVRVRSAREAAERAGMLTRALQEMRESLEDALVEAREARAEARERADQAEGLADELRAQASQLQDQAAELEMLNDELVTRTEEAERAQADAAEANRAKSEFLASMSHELRTPINAVIGYAELLEMEISGPVTPGQRTHLERIRTSSAHLLSLVDDVLDLARVEAGRLKVEHRREPVAAVVAEALTLVERSASGRELRIDDLCRDLEASYVGDRDRVRQILANLLGNAIKFTEPGGRITVRGGTAADADPAVRAAGAGPWSWISVEDTGIGMTADQIERVFRPFVQADSGHTRQRGGTGLGLTISRQLARLMSGDLTVSSEAGRGSRFTLWLPAVPPEPGQLDPTIRVAAPAEAEPPPRGLAEAGALLQAELPALAAAFARRLRADPRVAPASTLDPGELRDHALVLVADLGRTLKRRARGGEDDEGGEALRIVAEEHGTDRARRGWGAPMVRREWEVLRDELVLAVRAAAEGSSSLDAVGAIRVLDGLLERAKRASLRSHRVALIAAGGEAPR